MRIAALARIAVPLALLAMHPDEAPAQNCGGPVLAPQLEAGDGYARSLVWSGQQAIVGAPGSDAAAPNAGALHVLTHLGAGYFEHEAQLLVPGPVAGEGLGASVDRHGQRLVAGAPDAGAGRAHVYVLLGSWTHEAVLSSGAAMPGDRLGAAAAIAGDWIALGAPSAAQGGSGGAGGVRLFLRSAGTWTEMGALAAPAPNAGGEFGASLSFADDATLLVGAPGDDQAGADSGAAYLYARSGTAWSLAATLQANDAAAGQRFGAAVALDGLLAAVGAPGADFERGAVYAFDGSGGWAQEAKLGAAPFAAGDRFGSAVDAEAPAGGQPRTILAGAPGVDGFSGPDTGLAVAYTSGGGNPWIYYGAGVAPDGVAGDGFGAAVTLEGGAALAGTPLHDSVGAGSGSASGFTFLGDCFSNGAFCSGDGSGTPCPCGNAGLPGDGCANSGGHGATLQSWGFPSLSNDTLSFGAWNLLPNQPALLFVGENDIANGYGVAFGDGLRCVGGGVVRLGVRTPDAQGYAEWGPGIATATGAPAFSTRFFQVWYRDPTGSPCGSGFNLSNAWVRTLTF